MATADLSSELRCSICIDIYIDPVTLPCGHSFCRNCITKAWDHQGRGDFKCPECKQIYGKRPELKINVRLLNIAKVFRYSQPDEEETGVYCTYCESRVPAAKSCLQCETSMCDNHLRKHNETVQHALIPPTRSVRDRKCSIHKKILEHYCAEDSECLCESCRHYEEHKGHLMESLDEASEKKKRKLRNILEKMITRKEEIEDQVRRLQESRTAIQEKAAKATERITALFRDIRRQLEDLEKKVLRETSKQEEKISRSVSNLIRRLEMKKGELSRKMQHIEEMINMADSLTVLQDQESDKEDFSDAEIRDDIKITDVGDLTFSDTLYADFSDIMKCANILFYTQDPADLMLDRNTAANNLKVFHTLRTVRWSQVDLNHPQIPERFEKYQEKEMKTQAEKAWAEDNARFNALQESTVKIVSDLQKETDALAQDNNALKMDQTMLNTGLALLKEKDELSNTQIDNMEPKALATQWRESSEETPTTRRRESFEEMLATRRRESSEETPTTQRRESFEEILATQRRESSEETLISQPKRGLEETLASQPRRGLEETLATWRKESSEETLQRPMEQQRHVDLAFRNLEFSYVSCPCCGHILSKTRSILTMEYSDLACSLCGRQLLMPRPGQEITRTPHPPSGPRKPSMVPRVYRIFQSNKQETDQDTSVQKRYKAMISEKPPITPQQKAVKPAPTDLRRRERLFPSLLTNKGRPILVTWRK